MSIFFPEKSLSTESQILSIDCVETLRQQLVQYGIPILANNSLM